MLLDRVRVVIALRSDHPEAWLRAAGWWERLPARDRPAFGHGAVTTFPMKPSSSASYHPSRQNTNTGRLTRAMWYEPFREARRSLGRERRGTAAQPPPSPPVQSPCGSPNNRSSNTTRSRFPPSLTSSTPRASGACPLLMTTRATIGSSNTTPTKEKPLASVRTGA